MRMAWRIRDAGVQAQQVAVLQGRQQAWRATLDSRCWVMWSGGTKNRISSRPTSAIPAVNQNSPCRPNRWVSTAEHHGHGEGDADAHADHRHRLGPVLLAGEVGEQCHHRRRDRPGALQDAAGDHPQMESALAARRAGGEDQQPDDDHRAPADAVGNGPEGNLQDRLGQAIGADGQADQRRVAPARSWP